MGPGTREEEGRQILKTISEQTAKPGKPIFRLEFEGDKVFLVLGTERLAEQRQIDAYGSRDNGEIPREHQALRSGALKGHR